MQAITQTNFNFAFPPEFTEFVQGLEHEKGAAFATQFTDYLRVKIQELQTSLSHDQELQTSLPQEQELIQFIQIFITQIVSDRKFLNLVVRNIEPRGQQQIEKDIQQAIAQIFTNCLTKLVSEKLKSEAGFNSEQQIKEAEILLRSIVGPESGFAEDLLRSNPRNEPLLSLREETQAQATSSNQSLATSSSSTPTLAGKREDQVVSKATSGSQRQETETFVAFPQEFIDYIQNHEGEISQDAQKSMKEIVMKHAKTFQQFLKEHHPHLPEEQCKKVVQTLINNIFCHPELLDFMKQTLITNDNESRLYYASLFQKKVRELSCLYIVRHYSSLFIVDKETRQTYVEEIQYLADEEKISLEEKNTLLKILNPVQPLTVKSLYFKDPSNGMVKTALKACNWIATIFTLGLLLLIELIIVKAINHHRGV